MLSLVVNMARRYRIFYDSYSIDLLLNRLTNQYNSIEDLLFRSLGLM